jgi:hypothetical protein
MGADEEVFRFEPRADLAKSSVWIDDDGAEDEHLGLVIMGQALGLSALDDLIGRGIGAVAIL